MSKKTYSVDEVLKTLSRNPDVKVRENVIYVLDASHSNYQGKVGNSTRGKLSFLQKHGYTITYVKDDNKPVKNETKK